MNWINAWVSHPSNDAEEEVGRDCVLSLYFPAMQLLLLPKVHESQ